MARDRLFEIIVSQDVDEHALSEIFAHLTNMNGNLNGYVKCDWSIFDPDDDEDIDFLPPLTLAAFVNNVKVVKILLEQSVDINFRDKGRWTALMTAAANGKCEVVNLLSQHQDININCEDRNGMNALTICMKFLPNAKEKDADSYLKTAMILINSKAININHIDPFGYTALMRASYNGHLELVQEMLKVKNIDVNYEHSRYRWNATSFAFANNQHKILDLLVSVGSHVADESIIANSSEAVKLLVETGNIKLIGKIQRIFPY